jgi:serine/threonine protein kinase
MTPPVARWQSDNRNEVLEDIARGKRDGRYKDCVHLSLYEYPGPLYGDACRFSTTCSKDSLQVPREGDVALIAAAGMRVTPLTEPRCPDPCHSYAPTREQRQATEVAQRRDQAAAAIDAQLVELDKILSEHSRPDFPGYERSPQSNILKERLERWALHTERTVKELVSETEAQRFRDRRRALHGSREVGIDRCRSFVTVLKEALISDPAAYFSPSDPVASTVKPPTHASAKKGRQIPGWEIERPLDSPGGQAFVYIARREGDPEPRTRFVLKVPKNPKRAARHRDEVEAAVRLKHPGIAHVDYFGLGEPTFLATRFYPKGDLKKEHVEHLSPVEKLKFFAKLCRAVGFAHENKVIHRDIKPANVLVSDEGDPLLTDFGICWFQDREHGERATRTMEQVGPRFYMAPELADGRADPDTITPAADVYSHGKVLYWVFAGTIFDREKHNDPKYDLRGKEPRIAHGLLYQLLDKSIVEKPKDRFFQSGTQLAETVESVTEILSTGGHVLDLTVPQPCTYCRAGNYEITVDPRWWEWEKFGLVQHSMSQYETQARELSTAFGLVFSPGSPRLVLRCANCGHVESFSFSRGADNLKNWKLPEPPKA